MASRKEEQPGASRGIQGISVRQKPVVKTASAELSWMLSCSDNDWDLGGARGEDWRGGARRQRGGTELDAELQWQWLGLGRGAE